MNTKRKQNIRRACLVRTKIGRKKKRKGTQVKYFHSQRKNVYMLT